MPKKHELIEHPPEPDGVPMPRIKGSRIRVSDIVGRYQQLEHETPEERIRYSYPFLTLEEIRAALDYWRAHPDEIAAEMASDEAYLEELKARLPFRAR